MLPRTVFMGTPEFGVPTLRFLTNAGFPVTGVVTQPDRPKGRGYQDTASPVKQAAEILGLSLLQPDTVNTPEFLEKLTAWEPEIVVVVAFGQILKTPVLELPALGCINLHASLLPKYRGASPIQWAIANGEQETGITVQKMALAVDSGDILVQARISIGPDETAAELAPRLADLGGPAVSQAIRQLADPQAEHGRPQDHSQATFAPKLGREDGWIDWRWPAAKIHNRCRGFYPWPGVFTTLDGQVLKVLRTQISEASGPAEPGTILACGPEIGWRVAAGERTALRILEVQGPNTKRMTAHAYACGHPAGVGTVLGTRRENHGG